MTNTRALATKIRCQSSGSFSTEVLPHSSTLTSSRIFDVAPACEDSSEVALGFDSAALLNQHVSLPRESRPSFVGDFRAVRSAVDIGD